MTTLRVQAGPHARRCCPVAVELPIGADRRVSLYQEPGRRPRACQLEPAGSGSRLWWIVQRLDAGASLDYTLEVTPRRHRPVPRLRWEALGIGQLQLLLDGRPVAVHDHAPLRTFPGFAVVNGPSPAGPWPALADLHATARVVGREHASSVARLARPPSSGSVFSDVEAANSWLDPAGRPILEDVLRCRAFATPGDLHLLDMDVSLRAAVGPVRFAAEGLAGLLTVRLTPDLLTDGLVSNSAGAVDAEVNEYPAPWVHAAGKPGGVALLEHPGNPGAPGRWRLGADGLIQSVACPAAAGLSPLLDVPALTLDAGEAIAFRYRLVLHAPDRTRGLVRQRYLDWLHPPRVEVL